MSNVVRLTGRLVADAVVRDTSTGRKVTNFRLAVGRVRPAEGQPTADFIPVVFWGEQALLKGQLTRVEGRIQTRSFTGRDGQDRWVTEVVARAVTPLGVLRTPEQAEAQVPAAPAPPAPPAAPQAPALELSSRVRKALEGAGYRTVANLRRASDEELLQARGIGPASLREIREALAAYDAAKARS